MAHEEARFCVIAYDVSCDRRRRRLEKLAGAYAVRVQGSVFEGHLTEKHVAALLRRAEPWIRPPDDSLRVYRLCAECGLKAHSLGGPALPVARPAEVFAA